MVEIDDKDLYQLLISEFRYAVKRDNHLAPGTCVQHITTYLPELSKQWRSHTAYQLTDEIITERIWGNSDHKLEQDSDWEKLLVFLTNYLESFPLNIERYMQRLYLKPEYDAHIDYYSAEMAEKIVKNQAKNNYLA
jgi:hypothetical protein